jgi:hypothetical protein
MFTNFLARVLPTVAVDRALKGLARFASALAAAETAQNDRANQISRQIANLRTEREVAREGAERASRVRQRLLDLTA